MKLSSVSHIIIIIIIIIIISNLNIKKKSTLNNISLKISTYSETGNVSVSFLPSV